MTSRHSSSCPICPCAAAACSVAAEIEVIGYDVGAGAEQRIGSSPFPSADRTSC